MTIDQYKGISAEPMLDRAKKGQVRDDCERVETMVRTIAYKWLSTSSGAIALYRSKNCLAGGFNRGPISGLYQGDVCGSDSLVIFKLSPREFQGAASNLAVGEY